jgi:integrase
MAAMKTAHGSVAAYTRHSSTCSHRDDTKYNSCSCPKWVYIRKQGMTPERKPLSTPSWAEAQTLAANLLKGFDPEIAAAREEKKIKKKEQTPWDAAIRMWESRPNGGKNKYPDLTLKLKLWSEAHGINYVQEVTTLHLERWHATSLWTEYALTTRSQRWGVMRSFFAYLTKRKVLRDNPILPIDAAKVSRDFVQGPYTDEQVNAIVAAVPAETARHKWASEVERVQLFLELLINVGCDVVDAVLHQPERIKDVVVQDRKVSVYRYKRRKTGVQAIVPLDNDVAIRLQSIPLVEGYSKGMPFRGKMEDLRMTSELWERRIKYCIKASGVKHVLLPGLDSHGRERKNPANLKQFRHTFAVRQLVAGQRPEEVAKMMGHRSTEMVLRHYGAWVQEMDDGFILQVLKHM